MNDLVERAKRAIERERAAGVPADYAAACERVRYLEGVIARWWDTRWDDDQAAHHAVVDELSRIILEIESRG